MPTVLCAYYLTNITTITNLTSIANLPAHACPRLPRVHGDDDAHFIVRYMDSDATYHEPADDQHGQQQQQHLADNNYDSSPHSPCGRDFAPMASPALHLSAAKRFNYITYLVLQYSNGGDLKHLIMAQVCVAMCD